MFNFQNPVQSQRPAAPAGLNHLLLVCRFDFRQKIWGFPAAGVHRDSNSILPAHSAALAAAISKNLSDFSDPALGGTNPSKTVLRRIGFRHSLGRSLGKTKPTKNQK
jgi:hypothetical protein